MNVPDSPAEETAFSYVGQELDHFRLARNWKAYWCSQIREFLGREVLEVGAGNGNNSAVLLGVEGLSLTALEPDAALVAQHRELLAGFPEDRRQRARLLTGTLADLPAGARFDSILYIDVLEHIEDDAGEVRAAIGFLRPGGRLIVLSPAFMMLFSPFDTALGHYRRYTRASLAAVVPPALRARRLRYLDSLGFTLSLGNGLLLRRSVPTRGQIRFWDGTVVPLSRALDPFLGEFAGRSVLGIWEKS
jgi:SAM-dependent methyltransferase